MKFTPKEFKAFSEDINNVLNPVAEKYALNITTGSISYSENTFTVKITCTKTDAGDLQQKDFIKICSRYGLSPDDYKREFDFNGDRFELVELSVSSPKYPCICINLANKKQYKFTLDTLKTALRSQH